MHKHKIIFLTILKRKSMFLATTMYRLQVWCLELEITLLPSSLSLSVVVVVVVGGVVVFGVVAVAVLNHLAGTLEVETILRQSLAKRSQMAFFHSDIHTVGAGSKEMGDWSTNCQETDDPRPVEGAPVTSSLCTTCFKMVFISCQQDTMNWCGETAEVKMCGATWQMFWVKSLGRLCLLKSRLLVLILLKFAFNPARPGVIPVKFFRWVACQKLRQSTPGIGMCWFCHAALTTSNLGKKTVLVKTSDWAGFSENFPSVKKLFWCTILSELVVARRTSELRCQSLEWTPKWKFGWKSVGTRCDWKVLFCKV